VTFLGFTNEVIVSPAFRPKFSGLVLVPLDSALGGGFFLGGIFYTLGAERKLIGILGVEKDRKLKQKII
jgi:hypothetical protein